eukprot:m51a1_g9170 hypothetical protein (801) ;mRNA; f:27134-31248
MKKSKMMGSSLMATITAPPCPAQLCKRCNRTIVGPALNCEKCKAFWCCSCIARRVELDTRSCHCLAQDTVHNIDCTAHGHKLQKVEVTSFRMVGMWSCVFCNERFVVGDTMLLCHKPYCSYVLCSECLEIAVEIDRNHSRLLGNLLGSRDRLQLYLECSLRCTACDDPLTEIQPKFGNKTLSVLLCNACIRSNKGSSESKGATEVFDRYKQEQEFGLREYGLPCRSIVETDILSQGLLRKLELQLHDNLDMPKIFHYEVVTHYLNSTQEGQKTLCPFLLLFLSESRWPLHSAVKLIGGLKKQVGSISGYMFTDQIEELQKLSIKILDALTTDDINNLVMDLPPRQNGTPTRIIDGALDADLKDLLAHPRVQMAFMSFVSFLILITIYATRPTTVQLKTIDYLVIVWVLGYVVAEGLEMRRGGVAYFKSLWNMFDMDVLTTLMLSVIGSTDISTDGISPQRRTFLMILFAVFSILASIVLINLLIAIMNSTYSRIADEADIQYKVHFTGVVLEFAEKPTLPSPLNLVALDVLKDSEEDDPIVEIKQQLEDIRSMVQQLRGVYIIRHGERLDWVDKNWARTSPRPWDTPLSARGLCMADELAQHVAALPQALRPAHIVCSPLVRVIQTAAPTARLLGLRIKIEAGLTEWPPRPALPRESLAALFPGLIDEEYAERVAPSGPEDPEQMHDRADVVVRALLAQREFTCDGPVALFTHAAGVIAFTRAMVRDRTIAVRCGIASTTVLVKDDKSGADEPWKLVSNGDASYLSGGEERVWSFDEVPTPIPSPSPKSSASTTPEPSNP